MSSPVPEEEEEEEEAAAQKEEETATVSLTSSDGEVFEVEAEALRPSVLVRHMMEDGMAEGGIWLPEVSGRLLAVVVEYLVRHRKAHCRHRRHRPTASHDTSLADFDKRLVNSLDLDTLLELTCVANYMEIEELLALTCQTVADMFKDKTIPQIRRTFHIVNDYTPEEEEQVQREISWSGN